jgi:hypothetical protein
MNTYQLWIGRDKSYLSKPYWGALVFTEQINQATNIYNLAKSFHLKIAALCNKLPNKLNVHFILNIIQDPAGMYKGLSCTNTLGGK